MGVGGSATCEGTTGVGAGVCECLVVQLICHGLNEDKKKKDKYRRTLCPMKKGGKKQVGWKRNEPKSFGISFS
jgi:hypothetical protein